MLTFHHMSMSPGYKNQMNLWVESMAAQSLQWLFSQLWQERYGVVQLCYWSRLVVLVDSECSSTWPEVWQTDLVGPDRRKACETASCRTNWYLQSVPMSKESKMGFNFNKYIQYLNEHTEHLQSTPRSEECNLHSNRLNITMLSTRSSSYIVKLWVNMIVVFANLSPMYAVVLPSSSYR